MTPTKEDYLRAIDHLQEKYSRNARAMEVAGYLHLAKSTVSERLDDLVADKLLKPKGHTALELTVKGKHIARKLTYRHRLIEVFLHDKLKIRDKKIHEEAHKLEHAFSDDAIEKLKEFLHNPKNCPHGKPLPKVS